MGGEQGETALNTDSLTEKLVMDEGSGEQKPGETCQVSVKPIRARLQILLHLFIKMISHQCFPAWERHAHGSKKPQSDSFVSNVIT